MSAVSRYGATTLTGKTCGPEITPALWITASIRPRRFTWPATPRVSSRSDRSPTTGRSAPVQEVTHGGEPVAAPSVDDDLVPVLEQRLRSPPSETVCGTGDEDAC